MAALVDVLEICYHHKNRLENAASLQKVKEISSQLPAALGAYCDKTLLWRKRCPVKADMWLRLFMRRQQRCGRMRLESF